jgi:hypothetical protein
MKKYIKRLPILGPIIERAWRAIRFPFHGSAEYWERRYAGGGDSGVGSQGSFAKFKAQVINTFVSDHDVTSVIEFGCGDGVQLELAQYPVYLGLDVSRSAVSKCRSVFAEDSSKRFLMMDEYNGERADLALSLDVIYHLVEDGVFERHLRGLFSAAERYVIIYSSNQENEPKSDSPHVRHRRFSDWVDTHLTHWRLIKHVPNKYRYTGDYHTGSFADFYIYERIKPD